jgi:hypothetical protein
VRGGDLIRVDFENGIGRLTFFKEAEDMPAYAMVQMVDTSIAPPLGTYSAGATADQPRAANAGRTRR